MLHLMQSGAAHIRWVAPEPACINEVGLSFSQTRLRAGLAPVILRLFGVVCNAPLQPG